MSTIKFCGITKLFLCPIEDNKISKSHKTQVPYILTYNHLEHRRPLLFAGISLVLLDWTGSCQDGTSKTIFGTCEK